MPDVELDAIDKKILNILQKDGRMTNIQVAAAVNLSPSACLRRIKQLENTNVIDGYVMLVNGEAVGKSTIVFVEITLTGQSEGTLEAFEAAVQAQPDILECYLVSGSADYLVKVAVSDTADFERVRKRLGALPGLARAQSSFVLRTVAKSTSFQL